MKKLVVVLLALMAICALAFGSVQAFAEEEPVAEQPAAVEEATEEQSLKDKLAAALAKLNEYTSEDNFLKNKVLPYIINGGINLIVVGILILRPYLKKKSLADKLTGAAAQLQAEKENLSNLLTSTDPEKIKEAMTKLLGDNLNEVLNGVNGKMEEYFKTFAAIKTTSETEYSLLKNFAQAAALAWASKPEVVALLTASPEKSTLENLTATNENLKAYIREIKGEEAEETLKQLEV